MGVEVGVQVPASVEMMDYSGDDDDFDAVVTAQFVE